MLINSLTSENTKTLKNNYKLQEYAIVVMEQKQVFFERYRVVPFKNSLHGNRSFDSHACIDKNKIVNIMNISHMLHHRLFTPTTGWSRVVPGAHRLSGRARETTGGEGSVVPRPRPNIAMPASPPVQRTITSTAN